MKVACFCKHKVSVLTVKKLIDNGISIALVVVMDLEKENDWYKEIHNICINKNIVFLSVKKIKEVENINIIKSLNPDLIFSIYFTQIIPNSIIKIPRLGIINFHPSLLPKYRGPHPVNWSVVNGEKMTGLTAHFMTEDVDAGEIITQKEVNISFDDTSYSLGQKISSLIPNMAIHVYELILSEKITPIKQNEKNSSYFPRRKEKDDIINWKETSLNVYNLVRALYYPLPGAVTFYNNIKFKIRKVEIIRKNNSNLDPGTIINIDSNGLMVKTIDGAVFIKLIDTDTENSLTIKSILSLNIFDINGKFNGFQ